MRKGADGPIRVLQVMHRLSTDGGVQVVVRRLARSLDPTDVELHVVTARPLLAQDRLDEVPATIHPLGHSVAGYRWWQRLRVMWGVAMVARSIRAEVVQVHSGATWIGGFVKLLAPRARVVLEVHDAPGSGRHSPSTDWIEGLWVRRFGAVAVCHSSSVEGEVQRRWRPPAARIVTFPLAVDTDRFQPASPERRAAWRAAHSVPDGLLLMTAVGRFVPSKRFDQIVRMVAALRRDGLDVGVALVGDGPDREELVRLAERLGVEDRVWMTGSLSGEPLADAFAASDLVCSASAYEGFGLTLIEAMATGRPVVAVAVGGVPDVVEDQVSGLLVADEAALEHAVHSLISDPQRRRQMGDAGRRRAVERFGLAGLGAAFTGVYRNLARPGRSTTVDR